MPNSVRTSIADAEQTQSTMCSSDPEQENDDAVFSTLPPPLSPSHLSFTSPSVSTSLPLHNHDDLLPPADSEVSVPLIKGIDGGEHSRASHRAANHSHLGLGANNLFDNANTADVDDDSCALLTPAMDLLSPHVPYSSRRSSNHSLQALRSVKSLEVDETLIGSPPLPINCLPPSTATNALLASSSPTSSAASPAAATANCTPSSANPGRTVATVNVPGGVNPSSVFSRRGSRSLDLTRLSAEDGRADTILEVPLELLGEQERALAATTGHSLPPSVVLLNSPSPYSLAASAGAHVGTSPSIGMSGLGGGVKRRWPSFRQKFSRFGSLRKFASQTLNSTSFDVGCGGPGSLEGGLGTFSGGTTTSADGGIKKCDAKVQFDDEALMRDMGCLSREDSEGGKQSTGSYLKEQFFAFFQPSDNKLAMKLFGNKNALMKEKRRQQQQGKWVIHPCSNFRFYWDLIMLVMLIANLIILPVAISFFNDDLSTHWIVFNCVSDTVFLVDIAVNFRTGVIANDYADEIVLEPREIAWNYVKTWFFLDLISSIPMDYIFLMLNEKSSFSQLVHAGRALRILRLAKLLSLLRLLRLSRLVRYVSQWEEFLNVASKFMRIFNLVLLMLLLGHWNACLQFLIPLLRDFPKDSWVSRNELENKPWFQQYTWALFKAMSHMLSIGYGQYPPKSVSEAWITIVSMMTGATCYALFVGHAAALIQSFDTSRRLYREKFKQVEEYMAYRKLPRALRQRIANYYEHRYQGKMFDEDAILGELSECLREQVINYNCRALVAAVPFFTYADHDFVSEVVTKLQFEVFQPGDLIIKEGTLGMRMYFIQEGIVDIITKDGEVATSLSDGSYFGEICLLTNAKRVASVRAETYCNLYSLDRVHFLSVLEHYPLMRRTMESIAAERLSKIGQNPSLVSTRANLKDDLSLVKEIVSSATPDVSDSDSEHEPPPEKEKRRKSVVKLGLQKLGLAKPKSSSNQAQTSHNNNNPSTSAAEKEQTSSSPKNSLCVGSGSDKRVRSSSSCFGSPTSSPTSPYFPSSPTPASPSDENPTQTSPSEKETPM